MAKELYKADFHKPGSLEAGAYGPMRGLCFGGRPLQVVAVVGLLWISWCVLGGADYFVMFFFFLYYSWSAHGLLQV